MTDGVVSFDYQLNISCLDMRYFCEYYSACFSCAMWGHFTFFFLVETKTFLTAWWVSQTVQPVDQVNPSGRRDTTGCDWAGVSRTAALTLMKHARVPGHSLLEMMRGQVRPTYRVRWHRGYTQQAIMGTLHGHVRWVSSHHALGEEDEERRTYPCINDMQMNAMH